MPQFFPYGHPFDEPISRRQTRGNWTRMYGYTGKDQELTLMKFIFAAGARNYTPGEERLKGGTPVKVEIKPLAPPPEVQSPAASTNTAQPDASSAAAQTPSAHRASRPRRPSG